MEISEEDMKSIMSLFLDEICTVSDLEYQQRVWIEGKGPECNDYDEFYDYFFNEGNSIIENYKDFKITKEQHRLLENLRKKIYAFDHAPNRASLPKDFLISAEWKHIMESAKEVLKAFNYKK